LAKGERDIEVDGARKKGMEMSEHDDLAKRVSELERDLAEAKKALEALKPKEPFVPRMTMQPIDYTENFRLPPDAAQKMAAVVPDPPKKVDMGAWARNRIGEPGGFGPGPARQWPNCIGRAGKGRAIYERTGWVMQQAKVNVVRGIDLREVVSIEEGAGNIRVTFKDGARRFVSEADGAMEIRDAWRLDRRLGEEAME
jgi:hypothetical protein